MSLPGVFGALTYEAAGSHVNVLPSAISLSASPPEPPKVQLFLLSLPGVLGLSWYHVSSWVDEARQGSAVTSAAESSQSSSTRIPVPGVWGGSSSCTAGDVGLLLASQMSGLPSTTLPVGVTGLRCSADPRLPVGPSSSESGPSSAITDKYRDKH